MAALPALLVLLLVACGGGGERLTDRLLVVRNEGIVEFSLWTNEERLLVPNPPESLLIEPAVSPDGQRFAYARQLTPVVRAGEPVDFGTDLHLANRDGSDDRPILQHMQPNEHIRSPAWLPDGERLLVAVHRLEGTEVLMSVELFHLASGRRTLIVEGGSDPAVSPDGTRMAYVTQDQNLVQTLWLANIDGSDATVLAGQDDGLGNFRSPRFSPDGALLAFGASEPGGLGIQGAPPHHVSRFTDWATLASDAVVYNGFPMDIWVIEIDGGKPRRIADLDLDLPSLAWAADGSRIFVLAGKGVFVMNPDGGSRRQVAEGTFHGQLDWLAGE